MGSSKKLHKITKGKKISGVCMGIADYIDVDVTLVRIIWVAVSLFMSILPGLFMYFICAVIMPEDNDDDTINGDYKEL